jgi:uncharacterized protein YbjT (DUF2867 family)
MNTPTVLVIGATGTVGSALVPALRARGATVRAMTRNPDRPVPGVENVVADLQDPQAVADALKGVDAAFLNSPSTEGAAALQIRFAEIARECGVERLVLLSQYGARTDSPVRFLRWHAEVEQHVHQLGTDHTVLRPNLYMQALLGFAATIAHGVLAAPRAVSHGQIAHALSTATGREIAFQEVAPADFTAALTGLVPPWVLDGLVEDYSHYARGEAAVVHSCVADLTGHPARDITEFARDHATAFVPA